MGEVYRARDTRLGRDVALKVLPADLANDATRQRRFEQEARAMAALNHPNVATVFDVGVEGSISYLVTEVVDGESLKAIIDRGPLPVRTALDIAGQVAEGLAAAHAAGIVHRDLKPGNIMLTRQGRAKVLDFGLAKQVIAKAAAADATISLAGTEAGVVIGTFGYMSPEQVRGHAVDERSDIFSGKPALGAGGFACQGVLSDSAGETACPTKRAAHFRTPPALADSRLCGVRLTAKWPCM